MVSMHAFNQSLKYDQRMHKADIRGSIAYAKALGLVGILTQAEVEKIVNGLETVGSEWNSGTVSAARVDLLFSYSSLDTFFSQFQPQPDDEAPWETFPAQHVLTLK